MSDLIIGGVKFDSEKVFPKSSNKRADDVAKIYREAIEFGIREHGIDHFIARHFNKDDKGNDIEYTDSTNKKFTINNQTQQEAIKKLNEDKTFKYYLEKENKKAKGGSKTGYKIREKTAEELGQTQQPTPTPTTRRTTRSRTNTTTAKPTENQNSGKATNK